MRAVGALIVLGALLAVGCAPSSVQLHAQAATLTAGALSTGGIVVDEARRSSLARVEAASEGQPAAERIALLSVERARWQPVGASLDTARSALLVWVQSVETAHLAGEGTDLLMPLARLALRAVLLYDETAALMRELDIDAPELPAAVRSIAVSFSGGE